MRDKKCSFARYDPHLPVEAMVINEVNYPISPKYIKNKRKEVRRYLRHQSVTHRTENEQKKSGNQESKLAKAVPGYDKARLSQMQHPDPDSDNNEPSSPTN